MAVQRGKVDKCGAIFLSYFFRCRLFTRCLYPGPMSVIQHLLAGLFTRNENLRSMLGAGGTSSGGQLFITGISHAHASLVTWKQSARVGILRRGRLLRAPVILTLAPDILQPPLSQKYNWIFAPYQPRF